MMRKPLLAGLVLMLTLGACGAIRESRLNPLNWFGRSERAEPVAETAEVAGDPRALMQNVTALVIEPVSGGAIVRATGIPPTQGYWEAELVARPLDENGVQVYDFRAFPPPRPAAVSTPQSREITVAVFVSNFKLQSITSITVQGENGARSARR